MAGAGAYREPRIAEEAFVDGREAALVERRPPVPDALHVTARRAEARMGDLGALELLFRSHVRDVGRYGPDGPRNFPSATS
jgi:hypothetical protein